MAFLRKPKPKPRSTGRTPASQLADDSAEPSQTPHAEPAPTGRRTRAALGGVAGAAVVGAIATAVITSDRVDSLLSWVGNLFAPAAVSSDAESVATKTVTSADRVFTVDIPERWSVRNAPFDVFADDSLNVGAAMFVGIDIDRALSYDTAGAYIGASTHAPEQLGLVGATETELARWAQSELERFDWTVDGCVPTNDPVPDRDGWVVRGTVWNDCAANQGMRLIQLYALPLGGDVTIHVQMSLMGDDPDEVADTLVRSLAIVDSRIESGDPSVGDQVIP
ncbi:hypothetical protein [Salinibacterium sp. ZJ454]|uniref:hypothetical protein n=1 Tax=Salinibacterium sp. ZJ454 TaxID=2708339 RepID=UPI001423246A|nr:hypothetical protein [Salinibacterium sp. ZJ454]